jgi:Tetratricopeptide repeat
MPGEVLSALAEFAGQTVTAAAITDSWESVRSRFARLFGRSDARRTEIAEGWLAQTREQLAAAVPSAAEQVRRAAAARWAGRFADLLDEDAAVEAELRALVEEVAAELPAGAVAAAGYSVAAGRDVRITASGGSVAAGVIHGNVALSDPYVEGSGASLAAPGGWNLAPGSVAIDRGGTAIGTLTYQRRLPAAGLPVRLAPRPAFLAGREELLAEIDARLAPDPGRAEPRVAVLCGLGGAGKTSVAVEYAYRQLGEVGVCWQFAAEDPGVLAAQFAVLAAQLGARDLMDARDPVAAVHAVLARAQAEWLLVFDNAPDLAAVEAFLPPAGPGRVLITSQSQHWPAGWAVQVPALDPAVAAQLLVARTGDADQSAALQLAEELGGLPLALEQAAAYMQATGTPLIRYLPLYRARQAELLARGEATGHREHMAATLGLALARLGQDAPAAARLLRLLAFLAPEPVPLGLLLARQDTAEGLGARAVEALGPVLGDPLAAGDALTALRRYSLVSQLGDGLVQVHRLVQAVTRAQLTAPEAGQWQEAAVAVVEAAVPDDGQLPGAWPTFAVLLPHVRAVLDLTSGGIWQMAQYLGYSGSYPAARDLFVLIADAYRGSEDYGPEHPATLNARANLARWTGAAGDAAGARDQYTALLPIYERVLGPEHPATLATRHNLAYYTGLTGDAAGARDQFAALLPVYERVLGSEHPATLNARANLAYWTGAAGDAAGARDQYTALLPILERVQGPEHPDTLTTRTNLARWTGRAGDAADARDQYSALLPVCERVLGPEHLDTLNARTNLTYWTERAKAAGLWSPEAELMGNTEKVRLEFVGHSREADAELSQDLMAWLRADPGLSGVFVEQDSSHLEDASLAVTLVPGAVLTAFVRALAAWMNAHRLGNYLIRVNSSRQTTELWSGADATDTERDLLAAFTGPGMFESSAPQGGSFARLIGSDYFDTAAAAMAAAFRNESDGPRDPEPGEADASMIPVTIYLSDGAVHRQVEAAVEELLATSGLQIESRDDPIAGSWFRRMWATVKAAANSPAAREGALIAAHVVETRTVLSQDAAVTATLLQNLGPVLGALQPTKDAVIRAGALLIVKTDWVVHVYQLTAAQQAVLDLSPQLPRSPHEIIAALNLTAEDHQGNGRPELT